MAQDLYSQYLNPATPEIMGLERQRQYAKMLMAQSAQPQGQMVSGRYVAPAFTQQLQAALNPVIGAYLTKGADDEALKLADQLRRRQESATQELTNTMFGAPAQFVPQGDPLAGEMVTPAVQASPQDAFRKAMLYADVPQIRAMLPTIAEQALPKQITPYQQAQLDLEKQKLTSMTPYQQAQLGIERDRLELDKIKNLAKPLPEGLNKQVTGAVNLTDAIADYQNKIKNFGIKDFANPNKRAEMGNAYNNMMLQAKEAYNLGVLNGPDYDILQRVVKDPTNVTSLAYTNNALSRQADSLRTTASNIVKNAYMSQGREAPAEIMAKFAKVEAPKAEKQSAKEQLGLPNKSAIDAELKRRGLL